MNIEYPIICWQLDGLPSGQLSLKNQPPDYWQGKRGKLQETVAGDRNINNSKNGNQMWSSKSNLFSFIFQTKDISYLCQVQVQISHVL